MSACAKGAVTQARWSASSEACARWSSAEGVEAEGGKEDGSGGRQEEEEEDEEDEDEDEKVAIGPGSQEPLQVRV